MFRSVASLDWTPCNTNKWRSPANVALKEERGRLFEADRRITQGAYGRCLLCGKDIAVVRLENQPDAVTCVPCISKKK